MSSEVEWEVDKSSYRIYGGFLCSNLLLLVSNFLFLHYILPFTFESGSTTTTLGIVTVILAVLAFMQGWAVYLIDPGVIPRKPKDISLANLHLKEGERICRTCNILIPQLGKHCRLCDHCVEDFDHHCPYLSACIGKRNYRCFICFLGTTTVLSFFISYICGIYITKSSLSLGSLNRAIVAMFLLILSIIIGSFTVYLMCFQYYLHQQGYPSTNLYIKHQATQANKGQEFQSNTGKHPNEIQLLNGQPNNHYEHQHKIAGQPFQIVQAPYMNQTI